MATAKLFLFIGKKYKCGNSPVLLRVTHQRKNRYISIGDSFRCIPKEWNKKARRFDKNFKNYKTKNKILSKLEVRADDIIDNFTKSGKTFSIQEFEKQFLNHSQKINVLDFFEARLEELEKAGNYGNRDVYKTTYSVLSKFIGNTDLQFSDITYDFLHRWEIYLRANGCNDGGILHYMKTFRALINLAINRDIANSEFYPFTTQHNKKGYSLSHLKRKKPSTALSIQDMNKIKNFDIEAYPDLANTVRYFLFSYYARGINFSDMADLKWTQFYNNRFQYRRNKVGKLLSIPVSEPIEEILTYFKVERKENDSQYVFPILSDFHQTDTQKRDRRKKCLKNYNKKLKKVAEILEIQASLTSNVARHTYATTLLRKGIPIAQISQGLAHADKKTTETYLAQFDTAVIEATDDLL